MDEFLNFCDDSGEDRSFEFRKQCTTNEIWHFVSCLTFSDRSALDPAITLVSKLMRRMRSSQISQIITWRVASLLYGMCQNWTLKKETTNKIDIGRCISLYWLLCEESLKCLGINAGGESCVRRWRDVATQSTVNVWMLHWTRTDNRLCSGLCYQRSVSLSLSSTGVVVIRSHFAPRALRS